MRRVWRRTNPWAKVASAVVVLAVVGAGVWWFGFRGDDASAAAPITRTVQAATTTMEKTVSASGTVAPTVEEDVSFAVSGTVTSVPVTQGQTVKKGDVLAKVGTLQLKADLLEAKATLASAEATYSDAKDAADGSDASDSRIAAAKSQVEVAQAAVDTAQDDYAAATLKAPVSGLLTTVGVEVGDTVSGSSGSSGSSSSSGSGGSSSSGFGGSSSSASSSSSSSSSAQFVIVGTDAWQVAVTVSDSDIAHIKVGNQAELTVDGASGTVFGTVSEIGLLSTSSSGVASYPVTIAVTPDDKVTLHDGESADASIIYSKRTDVLAVPSLAVSTDTDGSYVTKVDAEGKQTKTPVTTGETSNQMTEITSGLSEGDSVVLVTFTPGGAGGGTTQRGYGNRSGQGGTVGGGLPGGFPGGGEGSGYFRGGTQGGGYARTGQGGTRG